MRGTTPHSLGRPVAACALLLAALATGPGDARRHAHGGAPVPVPPAGDPATRIEMRNVGFHLDDQIVLRVARLDGTMQSRTPGTPIVFDDKKSFVIHIDRAQVALSARDLSLLLNRYVFGYRGAPLKDLRVRTQGARLVQSGTLHKGVDIPFTILADPSVTPDGHIRLHPVRTTIFGVDGDRLMRALGLQLQDLLDLSKAPGASVHGNDILLAPDSILPPPAITGHLTGIRVEGDQIVQTFGDSASWHEVSTRRRAPPDPNARNFMYYQGGTLRFGKLMMLDADLQIIDQHPSDLFDFDIDHYLVQLVAGYSRTMPDGALEVFMPDLRTAQRAFAERHASTERP
ncbi:MAG: hypothetical protein IRY91_08220 [Gemmatimonadaceae bacterium]|nr:hypothetical protein [Gemmatimonadaceae bacterium]